MSENKSNSDNIDVISGKKETAYERAERQKLEFKKKEAEWAERENKLSIELIDKADRESELEELLRKEKITNKALDKQLWRERKQIQTGVVDEEQSDGQKLANNAFEVIKKRTRERYRDTCSCNDCRPISV